MPCPAEHLRMWPISDGLIGNNNNNKQYINNNNSIMGTMKLRMRMGNRK